jgi:hypothetical protein
MQPAKTSGNFSGLAFPAGVANYGMLCRYADDRSRRHGPIHPAGISKGIQHQHRHQTASTARHRTQRQVVAAQICTQLAIGERPADLRGHQGRPGVPPGPLGQFHLAQPGERPRHRRSSSPNLAWGTSRCATRPRPVGCIPE